MLLKSHIDKTRNWTNSIFLRNVYIQVTRKSSRGHPHQENKDILQILLEKKSFLLSENSFQLWSTIRTYYSQDSTGAIYSLAQGDGNSLGKIKMRNQSPVP